MRLMWALEPTEAMTESIIVCVLQTRILPYAHSGPQRRVAIGTSQDMGHARTAGHGESSGPAGCMIGGNAGRWGGLGVSHPWGLGAGSALSSAHGRA